MRIAEIFSATPRVDERVYDSVTRILESLVASHASRGDPKIFSGWPITQRACVEFADEAEDLITTALPNLSVKQVGSNDVEEITVKRAPGFHVFLKIGDRYYDSHATDGVSSPLLLPHFRRS